MKNRTALAMGIVTASALALVAERDAAACGGCFHPPTQSVTDITDERMLLSVSTQQTTLYDQIRYSGDPAAFAWVLPVRAQVTVALSADVLFDSMDSLTATQIPAPNVSCPAPPDECQQSGCSSSNVSFAATANGPSDNVTVIKQANVGPYETVQLHASDSSALNGWLAQNGFAIPAEVTPILDAYVSEGFDFLAMKLLPNQGVQAMRPVRVTMPGPSLSLPLRMASVGTGPTVGITIWVVSDGRYEPQNFPFFHIDDSKLVWDFKASASNYTTLRAQNEAALGGKGWEIESSIDLNEQLIQSVIQAGGAYFESQSVGSAAAPASDDYLAVGGDDGGSGETADQVRADDLAALFAGLPGPSVRVTRIRSDIAHAAMTTDLVLRASTDQSELSNVRDVTNFTGLSCPLYDRCAIVGYGTPAQAQASTSSAHGGCDTSSRSGPGPLRGLAAAGFAAALVLTRWVRARRRSVKRA